MEFFKRGDSLLVELTDGFVYDGILYTKNTECISLCGTLEYPSGKLIDHLFNVNTKEIATIRKIKARNQQLSSEEKNHYTFIEADEYKNLTNLANSFILIKQIDRHFYDAINHLEVQESISLDGKGCEAGRFNKLAYLILATWNQVYVFDISCMEKMAFNAGIRDLLESQFIVKIVHGCRLINDCLQYNYGVSVQNIFDIQVADLTLQQRANRIKEPKIKTLAECIVQYTNLPEGVIDNINGSKWLEKPISPNLKEMLPVKASFLVTLKNILQRLMNASLFNMTSEYYSKVCCAPSVVDDDTSVLDLLFCKTSTQSTNACD